MESHLLAVQAPVIEQIRAEVRLLGAGKVTEAQENGDSIKTEDVTEGQNDSTTSVTTPAANDSSPAASVATSADNDKSNVETSGSDEAKSPAGPKQKLSAKG